MYLVVPTSSQFGTFGYRLSGLIPPSGPFAESTARDDPIRNMISTTIALTFGADPLLMLRAAGSSDPQAFAVASPRPVAIPYSSLRDNIDYGRGLYSFLRGLGDHSGQRVAELNENGVRHCRLMGSYEYTPIGSERFSTPNSGSAGWGVITPQFALDAFQRATLVDSLHSFNGDVTAHYGLYDGVASYTDVVLDAVIQKLHDDGEYSVGTQFSIDGATHQVALKVANFALGEGSLVISYTVRYRRFNLFVSLVSEVFRDVTLTLRRHQTAGPIDNGATIDSYPLGTIEWTRGSRYYDHTDFLGHVNTQWEDLVTGGISQDSGTSETCCFGVSGIADVGDIQEDLINALDVAYVYLKSYDHRIEQMHDSLTAGAFYSTSEALHGYIDLIDTNMIEFLSEAREVGKLLPSLKGLVTLYRDIKNLRLLQAGVDVLDLIAELKLWSAFGFEPNTEVAFEFGNKHNALYKHAVRLSGTKTLYGIFKRSHEGLSLEFRSKIRVTFHESSFLTGIFGLQAMGLLPSPGQFWQALPFSFIVDYFFGIGQKLEAVDTQGMLLMLPCDVGTHSYTAIDYEPQLDLETFHFLPSGHDKPRAVCYYRGVSAMLPSLRGCDIDYSPPPPPPWDTSLAMIWKVIQ